MSTITANPYITSRRLSVKANPGGLPTILPKKPVVCSTLEVCQILKDSAIPTTILRGKGAYKVNASPLICLVNLHNMYKKHYLGYL